MTKALLIDTDNTIKSINITDYKDIQSAVGGLITTAPNLNPQTPECTIFVNDEGLLIGMPYNQVATSFANYTLVGPAVILGPDDEEGETTDVTADITNAVLEHTAPIQANQETFPLPNERMVN